MNVSSVWQCNVKHVLCWRVHIVLELFINTSSAWQCHVADMLSVHRGIDLFMNASSVWQCMWGLFCVCVCVCLCCVGAVYEYQLCLSVPCDSCPVFLITLFMNTSSVWECRLGHVLFSRWVGSVYEYQLCMGVPSGACSVFTVGWSCLWIPALYGSAVWGMFCFHGGLEPAPP